MSKKLPAFQYSPKATVADGTTTIEGDLGENLESSGNPEPDSYASTNEANCDNDKINNSRDTRRVEGEELTNLYAGWAGAAGGVPIPALDVALVTSIQIKLLSSLARIYDVDFSKHRLRSILGSILGGGAPLVIGGAAQTALPIAFGSISKAAFGFGTLIGAVTVGAASYASTLLIGKLFMAALESGREFSVSQLKEMSTEYLRERTKHRKNSPSN